MRGDNVAAVRWLNRCGGLRRKRACSLMRMLGRFDIKGRWSHGAKRISGVQNTLADVIWRWLGTLMVGTTRELTDFDN